MKRFIIIFWAILAAFILGYGIFVLKAPVKKLKLWQSAMETQNEIENKRVANDDTLKDITHHKVFLQNRLQMAKSDSINLVVNLRDSLVSIELKGVILHTAKIKSYKLPQFFNAIDINTLNHYFSQPLTISQQSSNVEKKPVKVKKAPKSPEEINDETESELPDTTLNIPVFVTLNVDTLFTLSFTSVYSNQENYHRTMRNHRFQKTKTTMQHHLKSIFTAKIPTYEPVIEIGMLSPDIIGIYKALPAKPQIAFMWP